MSNVPGLRIRTLNDAPIRSGGDYVLYWMTGTRRASWNFALDRADELARELDRPVLVLEALRLDYRWASPRLHGFLIDGMRDNAHDFEATDTAYYPYVEPERGAGKGLLRALARHACAVVTDSVPGFFLPGMTTAATAQMSVRFEAVDSNGLLPIAATARSFTRAYDFRRYAQRELPNHLNDKPKPRPVQGAKLLNELPADVVERWPPTRLSEPFDLSRLSLDHSVEQAPIQGGSRAATSMLRRFIGDVLETYDYDRNHPDLDRTSHLSAYLHFGHISSHQILNAVAERECWTPDAVAPTASGKRSGWWNMGASAEAFLDQLVTWRELGFNEATKRADNERFEALPAWAQETLAQHSSDPRPYVYTLAQFEHAQTHDELWNAAQRQLRSEGRMHNYLRMLWGKKILHWSASPRDALATMIELNNKYALDGRDPNSYSGIFWALGRYDRAWGPEREVFGKVRYMTSASTRRKLRVRAYLERWSVSSLRGNEQSGTVAAG